ncbi:MAG: AAA family ATPase, partial [Parvularculaceae bacterium]
MAKAAFTEDIAAGVPDAGPDAARDAARFRRLTLADFRSYGRADIALDGRPVVLAGPNGAGKTNILEAISLLGPGRGVRAARLEELPRIEGAGAWAVAARLEISGDETKLGVGVSAVTPGRRMCRIDERAITGPSAFS